MRITYMIGNGFDISLGLKTKYTDFYKYLQENSNCKDNIKNNIVESITNNVEFWSDLELALGKYTNDIGNDKDKLEKFFEDKYDLNINLMKYLENEQNKIEWKDNRIIENVRKHFMDYIRYFYNFFKPTDKDDILKIIGRENCLYNIITFNYTNIIEKCISMFGPEPVELFYLHGSLKDNDIILGVNDDSQIENTYFKKEYEMLLSICKIEMNNYKGKYSVKRAKEILDSSRIVCIFGMSIGDTDRYWWQKIVSNLASGLLEMVIIFHYEPNLDMSNYVKVYRVEKEVREKLLKYSLEKEGVNSKLKNKIKVLCNSNMFKLDLKLQSNSNLLMY